MSSNGARIDCCLINIPGIGTNIVVFAVTVESSPSLAVCPKLVEALT